MAQQGIPGGTDPDQAVDTSGNIVGIRLSAPTANNFTLGNNPSGEINYDALLANVPLTEDANTDF